MRCIALTQAYLEQGNQVTFLMSAASSGLKSRLQTEGIEIAYLSALSGTQNDAEQTISIASAAKATWIVIDGYQFGADYQQTIKSAGFKLLFIDDYGHANYYWADIVLNQNLYAHENLYSNRESYTTLLLGSDYALLRKEFWSWQDWQRTIPTVACKILVTLGGADPDNVTLNVIYALEQIYIDNLEVVVVVGASNSHYKKLQDVTQGSKIKITFQQNVTDMPRLMAWADVAITAGGSTCWELAFMGLPSLVIILADNQCKIAEKLDSMGIFINIGWHYEVNSYNLGRILNQLLISHKNRERISKFSQLLVDGRGSLRVIKSILGSTNSENIKYV